MDPRELLVIFMVFGGGFYVLRPIVGALAKRIAGDVPGKRLTDEPNEAVLAELAALRHEVAELAERVDFTERLLTKQQEAARLERAR